MRKTPRLGGVFIADKTGRGPAVLPLVLRVRFPAAFLRADVAQVKTIDEVGERRHRPQLGLVGRLAEIADLPVRVAHYCLAGLVTSRIATIQLVGKGPGQRWK